MEVEWPDETGIFGHNAAPNATCLQVRDVSWERVLHEL